MQSGAAPSKQWQKFTELFAEVCAVGPAFVSSALAFNSSLYSSQRS